MVSFKEIRLVRPGQWMQVHLAGSFAPTWCLVVAVPKIPHNRADLSDCEFQVFAPSYAALYTCYAKQFVESGGAVEIPSGVKPASQTKAEDNQIAVVVGDLLDGFKFHGPFPDASSANDWAEVHCRDKYYEVRDLHRPEDDSLEF